MENGMMNICFPIGLTVRMMQFVLELADHSPIIPFYCFLMSN